MAVPSRIIATEIDQNLSPRVTPKIAADNMVKVTAGTRIITLNRRPSAAPARTWIITISSAIVFSRFQTPTMSAPQRPTQRRSADQRPAHELAKPVPCHVPVPELADNCPLPLAL